MREENMNNYATYPDLLSPRPTLPPSQYPSQVISWPDWQNEPPIDVYQTYSEPSSQRHPSFIPHRPNQAAEMHWQPSFENQQAVSDIRLIFASRDIVIILFP